MSDAFIIHEKLIDLFGEPTWRNPLPPIDELISTILSQNTNDTNRDRAFISLKEKYPDWENVRDLNPIQIKIALSAYTLVV